MIDPVRHYHNRIKSFHSEPHESGGIVLLGSSHLEWFDTARFLHQWRIVNRGIASDRIGMADRGILHRLNVSVFDLVPCCVVLQNGVNDLGELWRTGQPSVSEILECYEKVVETVRDRLPTAALAMISILPTTGDFAGLIPWIDPFNVELRRIADRHGADFIDVYSDVVDRDQHLASHLTYDGLHLNEEGYRLFAAKLDTYFKRIDLPRAV